MASQVYPPDHIILSDNEGNYYLLPKAALEQAKVTGEMAKEVKELVDGGDTQGFSLFLGQQASALSLGGTQFQLRGVCACSASCSSFDRGAQVIR